VGNSQKTNLTEIKHQRNNATTKNMKVAFMGKSNTRCKLNPSIHRTKLLIVEFRLLGRLYRLTELPLYHGDLSSWTKGYKSILTLFQHFIPCVMGKKKFKMKLHEKLNTDADICMVSDEVALLLLENKYNRWKDIFNKKHNNAQGTRKEIENGNQM
jgi:hypothetical protein